jgi:SAM-dependent methyltransferase
MKRSKPTQMTDTVVRQFTDQVELYSHHEIPVASLIVSFLKKYLARFHPKTKVLKLGEFGGGGGDLLATIEQLSSRRLHMTNAELVKAYQKHQANKRIVFLERSVLDSKFADNTFDIVMVRNVIHHLVHTSLAKTRENQRHAIRELVRITKPGGLILIDEQINYSPISCTLFFYLSWLATKLKLNIPAFEITENTVVGYLTRRELANFCKHIVPPAYWVAYQFHHWPPSRLWRLTGLMEMTGSAFIAMRKP